MAPSRKSRSVNKRFSFVNEVTPNKNAEIVNKNKQKKRKLSDMLGPQWSKEEIERFYKAYRKHGKDWKKVTSAVRNRSLEMVEALYTMNKAYLSLPEDYASAAGLVAMMTDHYSNLENSESEQENNEYSEASQQHLKRARGTKGSDGPAAMDLPRYQSTASNYGCMSLLKKRRSGSKPWAVGKRTPRVPVSYSCDKDGDKYISPFRQGFKVKVDAVDDDVAHEIALALTEASQRGGSPQVSQTPSRKMETRSPVQNSEQVHAESEMTSSKLHKIEMDEGGCEFSLGSSEVDVRHSAREKSFSKGKRYHGKKPEVEESKDNQLDDLKEACSGTEEGQKQGAARGKFEMVDADTKLARSLSKVPRKRSKKVLFGEGEEAALDALQTLADLSLSLPEAPIDTESSVHVKEEKTGTVAKSKLKGNHSTPGVKVSSIKTSKQGKVRHDVSATMEAKVESHKVSAGMRKRRRNSLSSKISESEVHIGSHLVEHQKDEGVGDLNNSISKSKLDAVCSKQGQFMKLPEHPSSSIDHGRELDDLVPSKLQVLSAKQLNLPTKVRSRRKIRTPKPLIEKCTKSSENTVNCQSKIVFPSSHDRARDLKEKLSNCLSWYQVRKWCVFEWFYSAIDYPWFAKREFVEYLDHVGLGHIPRLTRVEWGVIRSSLGKPRRFSEQFLKEEKEKLNQYRESVRKHYAELRAGIRDGLPTDLARPLSVGQSIIALHPRTREIHDGKVLTVDHNRCRVQFGQPELGVEFVMDVDCMPLNPLDNMPASLTRQNLSLNKFMENFNELQMIGQPMERKMEGYIKSSPSENLESIHGPQHTSPLACHANNLFQQSKVSASSSMQVNIGSGETSLKTINNQQAVSVQPSILTHVHSKEADVRALSELIRALDKKEAVVSELKRMNDEVLENQKDDERSFKDLENFKKHYAAVLLQLNEVNEQVSSALFHLRQRNTYQGSTSFLWLKHVAGTEPVGLDHSSALDHSADDTQEYGSHVTEIVESSKTKAQTLVDVAMQAMSSLKKEGISSENLEEAIDFVNNQLSLEDLSTPAMRPETSANSVHDALASQDQLGSGPVSSGAGNLAPDIKPNNLSDQNEMQIPSDLIAQCVATLLMIQKCTERQFPPSDVAEILDSAVSSLKPCCSQNLPIYAEIQKCMGIIRNQILALIPS